MSMKRHDNPISREQDPDPLVPPGPQPTGVPLRFEEEVQHTADELRRQVFSLVYRQLSSIVGRSADLDDLAQTAAEHALRSLDTFEGRSEFSTWTYRICYHTLLKHRRWTVRWLRRFSLSFDEDVEARVDAGPTAVEALERRERELRLRLALNRLSPKRQAVVTLHDLEGMSIDEIANIVQANPRTVRSRLRDGRRRLERELARDPYFGEDACRRKEAT